MSYVVEGIEKIYRTEAEYEQTHDSLEGGFLSLMLGNNVCEALMIKTKTKLRGKYNSNI